MVKTQQVFDDESIYSVKTIDEMLEKIQEQCIDIRLIHWLNLQTFLNDSPLLDEFYLLNWKGFLKRANISFIEILLLMTNRDSICFIVLNVVEQVWWKLITLWNYKYWKTKMMITVIFHQFSSWSYIKNSSNFIKKHWHFQSHKIYESGVNRIKKTLFHFI